MFTRNGECANADGQVVHTAVRIRPPLRPTDPGFDLIPQRFQRSMVQVTSNTSLTIDAPQGRKLFVFDRVFGPEVNQEGIWDYLSDCVNAFVQGYNVSLLAYGQSGAGKSYTMGTAVPTDQDDFEMTGTSSSLVLRLFPREYSAGRPVISRAWSYCNRQESSSPRALGWGLADAGQTLDFTIACRFSLCFLGLANAVVSRRHSSRRNCVVRET